MECVFEFFGVSRDDGAFAPEFWVVGGHGECFLDATVGFVESLQRCHELSGFDPCTRVFWVGVEDLSVECEGFGGFIPIDEDSGFVVEC